MAYPNKTILIHRNLFAYSLILLVYIAFIIPSSPPYSGIGFDREIFQYIGMIIDHNMVPYTDAFDHKPPVIYLLNYLGFICTPNSTWGIFIILNILGFIAAILVYKASFLRTKNILLSICISLIFISLSNLYVFQEGGNLTRQVTAHLTIFIIYISFFYRTTFWSTLLSGFLLGLIFFTQQNEVLAPAVILVSSSLFNREFALLPLKKILIHYSFLLLGFIITCLLFGLLLVFWNNFADFIDQAYLFNFKSYIKNESYIRKLQNVCQQFFIGYSNVKILLLIWVILLINIIRAKKINPSLIILLLAFVVQLFSIALSGKIYGHYFLTLIPFLCFILLFSFKQLGSIYIYGISVALALLLFVQLRRSLQAVENDNPIVKEISREVSNVKNKAGQFYSFTAHYLRINYELNITSPSKWVYLKYANSPYFPAGKMINELLADLKKNKTTYILIHEYQRPLYPKVNELLELYYKPVLLTNSLILFKKE